MRRGIDDVEQTLVRPDFELFAAFLVDMWRAVHGEALDARRQRNGAPHLRACALCRVDDFPRRIVENPVIEGLEPDADILTLHILSPNAASTTDDRSTPYFSIFATTPAPTVRPPSRMAKRSFSSIAIGTISSTSTETLSPGITISVPSGSFTMPVTSVVRK